MSAEEKGFSVTPARVAFALSLIAVITFGWKIAAHAVTQEVTVAQHSEYIAENKISTKEILAELKELNRKVDRITFSIDTKQAARSPVMMNQ